MRTLCRCGCGKLTSLAKINRRDRGDIKGQPVRFVKGHGPRRRLSVRFWEKVKVQGRDECWIWTGAKSDSGYGILWDGKRTVRATHVAFFLETGKWPILDMCHTCDTPSCVRFTHLFEGTAKDNSLDALCKGRLKQWNRGHCKLTTNQKCEITKANQLGESFRSIGRRYHITHCLVSKVIKEALSEFS